MTLVSALGVLGFAIAPPCAAQTSVAFVCTAESSLCQSVTADLRAMLSERDIGLVDAPSNEAIALVDVALEGLDSEPNVRIRVEDRIGDKRVERTLSLRLEPPDTWSVVVAAAADELLQASWVEIVFLSTPSVPVPPAIRRWIDPRPFGVTAAASVEGYTGGAILFGGDLGVVLALGSLVAIDAAAIGRAMLPVHGAFGGLDVVAIGGDAGVRIALLEPASTWGLDLWAALRVAWIDLRPSPMAGIIAAAANDVLVALRGGVRVALRADRTFHAALALSIGAPLHGVVASDANGARMVALDGLELGARLELAFWP
jgi:hypothetical protein